MSKFNEYNIPKCRKYYNTSLLLLHQYHLIDYSLFELFNLRNLYKKNNNIIIEKVNHKAILIVENAILSKHNGEELMNLIKENNIIYKNIKQNSKIKIEDNFKLLDIYKNVNKMEKILNIEKDYLLNCEQQKNRFHLYCKYNINKIIDNILFCNCFNI